MTRRCYVCGRPVPTNEAAAYRSRRGCRCEDCWVVSCGKPGHDREGVSARGKGRRVAGKMVGIENTYPRGVQ